MNNRKQKNLRMSEEYHNKLEQIAVEEFNSVKKQGQAVEMLIDEYLSEDDDEVKSMVEDIHNSIIAEDGKSNPHTHTKNDCVDQVNQELLDKIDQGVGINPEKYDLTVFKGNTEKVVSAGECVVKYMSFNDDMDVTKKNVMGIVQRYFDYSINAAREKRDMILKEFETSVDEDALIEKCIEIEIEKDYHKSTELGAKFSAQPTDYKNMYDSLSEYLQVNIEVDDYYCGVDDYTDILTEEIKSKSYDHKQLRFRKNIVVEMLEN